MDKCKFCNKKIEKGEIRCSYCNRVWLDGYAEGEKAKAREIRDKINDIKRELLF